jgi:hypothetical protein
MPPMDHLFVLPIMPRLATWMGLPGRAFFLFAAASHNGPLKTHYRISETELDA